MVPYAPGSGWGSGGWMVGKIRASTSLANRMKKSGFESNSFLSNYAANNFVNLPENAQGS